MAAQSLTIRQAKRRAKLTNVGLALACLTLVAEFCRRCPNWLLAGLGFGLVTLGFLAVKFWPVTLLLISLWIMWRSRYRIAWAWAGLRERRETHKAVREVFTPFVPYRPADPEPRGPGELPEDF